MKLMTGWALSAGLVFSAAAANAQMLAPVETGYAEVSDIGGSYAALPRDAMVPRYGPILLPPQEVYAVVRESGFSPLGVPRQRGLVYTIAVIDRGGEDGRLVIDARTGRIIRFLPAYRMGNHFDERETVGYGPVGPPPAGAGRAVSRPPGAIPHVASRTPPLPMPKASPPRAGEMKPLAARAAEPAQQSASVQTRPVEAPGALPAAPPAGLKPSPILPTQEMPKAQGLD